MFVASNIRAYVELTRPQNASGSAVTFSTGYFLVATAVHANYIIGLIILLCLHSLATVQNDVQDYEIDKANNRSSALLDKSISLPNARFYIRALTAVALLLALLSSQPKLNLTAAAGLLLMSGLYNLKPVRASRKPVMSIIVMGICYGAIPFMYGYFLADGRYSHNYFLILTAVWFLARLSTAIMKDYKDVTGDKLFNKNTFYIHFGSKITAWLSIALAAAAYIGLLGVLIKLKNTEILYVAAIFVVALLAIQNMRVRFKLTKTTNEQQLNAIFHKSVFTHNQFEVAVLLCLILF